MSLSDTPESVRRGPSPMMWISLGLGAVVAAVLIVVVSLATGGSATPTNVLDGTRVASFSIPSLDHGRVVAPWRSGHPAVVLFFASWCGPCTAEIPRVATFVEHHHLGRVRVVGVDVNDGVSAGRSFVRHAGVRFPVGVDPRSNLSSREFRLPGLPDTVFVNGDGVVTSVVVGSVSNAQLGDALTTLEG